MPLTGTLSQKKYKNKDLFNRSFSQKNNYIQSSFVPFFFVVRVLNITLNLVSILHYSSYMYTVSLAHVTLCSALLDLCFLTLWNTNLG